MLSSVLRSQRAIQVTIAIMRTLVQMRHLATKEDLADRLNELERRELGQDLALDEHGKHLESVFGRMGKLLPPPTWNPSRRIGFPTGKKSHP